VGGESSAPPVSKGKKEQHPGLKKKKNWKLFSCEHAPNKIRKGTRRKGDDFKQILRDKLGEARPYMLKVYGVGSRDLKDTYLQIHGYT